MHFYCFVWLNSRNIVHRILSNNWNIRFALVNFSYSIVQGFQFAGPRTLNGLVIPRHRFHCSKRSTQRNRTTCDLMFQFNSIVMTWAVGWRVNTRRFTWKLQHIVRVGAFQSRSTTGTAPWPKPRSGNCNVSGLRSCRRPRVCAQRESN